MKAHEIMTKDVITVGPDTTVGEIAAVLVRHRINAVPVVAGGNEVIGLVSHSDLAHRSETGTERRRKWWLDFLTGSDTKAREYVKDHGLKAKDVMTRCVVSVRGDADLAEVADILDAHRIRQVPVMQGGRLAGIISRADIIRKLAEVKVGEPAARPDNGALQRAIRDRIGAQTWLNDVYVNFTVKDGVVELGGFVDSNEQRRALRVLVEGVAGVQKVEDNVRLMPKFATV